MSLPALLLALVAIVVFACAYLGVTRKWASVPFGLALLSGAWVCQLVFVGLHQYAVH